jgi:hypothetical protein
MPPSVWTDERLSNLFERYRRQYWPTSRRLKTFRVKSSSLEGKACGRCEFDERLLLVDVSLNRSDREVRHTLLHEMIHAVVGRGGHHAPFWTQLEYLLSRRAPITVTVPELGERGSHLHVIPARFRRCRRLFRPVHERNQRRLERAFNELATAMPVLNLTPEMVAQECEDAAIVGATWRAVWLTQSSPWGWVDLDGRVLPSAKPYHVAARRGYRKGRRFLLEEERLRARFAAMRPSATGTTDEGGA